MSFQESGHWYDANGNACHTQKCGPKAKNPTRATTIRDARKLKLFPSVTSILGILAKPQLERWKFRQITDAAYVHRRDMDEDTFFKSVCDSAFQQVTDAADAGTIIHDALEKLMKGLEFDQEQPVYLPQLEHTFPVNTFTDPVSRFMEENAIEAISCEKTVVNKTHGFAGMVDLQMHSKMGYGVLDYKTRKTTPGKPCTPYETQPCQIAAYASTLWPEDIPIGCNLFISTTEPGRIEATWYTIKELEEQFEMFAALCKVWQTMKNFNPTA